MLSFTREILIDFRLGGGRGDPGGSGLKTEIKITCRML